MNSKTNAHIIALTLFAALALTLQLSAQDKARLAHGYQHHHYQVVDVGTFGGPNSSYLQGFPEGRMLNNNGTAVGADDTPTPDPVCIAFDFDCYVADGFSWQNGVATPLSALPGFNGLNSASANWVSDSGLIAGLSENGIDPLTGGPAVEAVLWGTNNSLTDLGTLGGNQSNANAVNSGGQVAGEALNTIPDPYTGNFNNFFISGATQVHAFRWTNSRGMQDLGTLGGTDSTAISINERGQIAGWSFTNTTPNPVLDTCGGATMNVPTEDPFLWENGTMIDLGTLGGTCGQAWAINNRGQVVGFSDLAGDSGAHAFLWDHTGGMQDLGTLGGDTGGAGAINDAGDIVGGDSRADGSGGSFLWSHGVMTDLGTVGNTAGSVALGINSRRQIVGTLFDNNGNESGGFLWENDGPMVDLSTLFPGSPDLLLDHVFQINERGEITARGTFSNGDTHSFVLIPCDADHPGVEGCDYTLVDAATPRQSAAHATQHPPVGTPRGRMPVGVLNRFRSRWGQRAPVPGTVPAPAAEQTSSVNTDGIDIEGGQLLGPLAGRYKGYCGVYGSKLTGYCVAYSYYACLSKITSACPSGQAPKKPGYFQCANRGTRYVDLGRGCGFN